MSGAAIGSLFDELEERLETEGTKTPEMPECIPISRWFDPLEEKLEGRESNYDEYTACDGYGTCEDCPVSAEPTVEFNVEVEWPEIFSEEWPKPEETTAQEIELSETKIYLMRTGEYAKIGISKDPETRRRAIQGHNPVTVRLSTTIESDDPRRVEKMLHREFEMYQTPTEREWFELPDDVCEVLEGIDVLTPEDAGSLFEPTAD